MAQPAASAALDLTSLYQHRVRPPRLPQAEDAHGGEAGLHARADSFASSGAAAAPSRSERRSYLCAAFLNKQQRCTVFPVRVAQQGPCGVLSCGGGRSLLLVEGNVQPCPAQVLDAESLAARGPQPAAQPARRAARCWQRRRAAQATRRPTARPRRVCRRSACRCRLRAWPGRPRGGRWLLARAARQLTRLTRATGWVGC